MRLFGYVAKVFEKNQIGASFLLSKHGKYDDQNLLKGGFNL